MPMGNSARACSVVVGLLALLVAWAAAGAMLVQTGAKRVGTGAVGSAFQGQAVALSADGNTALVGGPNDNDDVGAVWVYTRHGGAWAQQGKLVGMGAASGRGLQGFSVALSADGNTAIVGGHADNGYAGAVWIYTRSGAIWTQQGAKLIGSGAGGSAEQGYSVALSADGNTALVGGPYDASNTGAAWVWTRSGSVWSQQGLKLVGTGAASLARQGWSVALSADGNTAVVGGPGDGAAAGAVWVWTRVGTTWTQQGTKLVGVDAAGNALQGWSVALAADGNTALVGGVYDDSNAGAAWVWTRSAGAWSQQGPKLVGSGATGSAQQGTAVALSTDGNVAVVGGRHDNADTGAVWIYTRSGAIWTQQGAKRVGTGATGSAQQGISVALSGDGSTAFVGGAADDANAGAVWIYGHVGWPRVQQGGKLVATGTAGKASQGDAVALSADGNSALVGGWTDNVNFGAAWAWTRSNGIWTQDGNKLVGSAGSGSPSQGHSVALSADGATALIGGPTDGGSVGAAWGWTRGIGGWTQEGNKLVGTGAVVGAYQGNTVALSADGNTALVGGYYDNAGVGAVWAYTRTAGVWTQQGAKLVAPGTSGRVYQGNSVALSADGNTALIGGYGDGGDVGAAWIWTRSGGVWQHGPKLVGTGATSAAYQGTSVALSADGNTALVGGYGDNAGLGAVWVWIRSANGWTQQGSKLVGTGAVGSAQQGYAVALSTDGNVAVVAGPNDNGNVGAVWVYTRSDGIWTQRGSKLVGSGVVASAYQGVSVALATDGATAIVGGYADNGNTGAAWIFVAADQTISFTSAAPTNALVGGATYTPTAVATSGLPVTITVDTSASGVCSIAGGVVSFIGLGTCVLNANQPGDGNYDPAPQATQSFAVTTDALYTVTFDSNGGTTVASQTVPHNGTAVRPTAPTLAGYAFDDWYADAGLTMVFDFATPITADRTLYAKWVGVFWVQQSAPKLMGADAVGAAFQGVSVAISADGNTAIVGGRYDNGNIGAAWVYTRTGGIWTQQGEKLVGSGAAGNANQGMSVALSADGNTALVGGPYDGGGVGAAWVWTRTGGAWTQQGPKLVGTGAKGASLQGWSVALSAEGNTVVVGGPSDDSATGAVWVWNRSGGVWNQQGAKLIGTGAIGQAFQGVSVAMSSDGSTVLMGGYTDDTNTGAAWVWTRSAGIWTQQGQKLVGGASGIANQGYAVALSADGNTAIVGGYADNWDLGAAWVWIRRGGIWTQQGPKLVGTGAVGGAHQGASVAISADGNTAFVGGDLDDARAGAVWPWTFSNGNWTQQGTKLVGTGAVGTKSQQGLRVALSADGNTALVGGPEDNAGLGAAWVFVRMKAAQVISFTSTVLSSAVVGGATYTPTATSTSGLPVTITVAASASSVCTIAGSVVSFISAGTCVLHANQPGNAEYDPAPQMTQSFAVTWPAGSTPNAFTFADQSGVSPGAIATSNVVAITGLSAPSQITVSGGSYSIGCGPNFTTAPGAIHDGQTVCLRVVAPAAVGATQSAALTVGGVTGTFNVTPAALPPDTTPPRIIAGPLVSRIGQTSATVTWQTDEATTTQADLAGSRVSDGAYVISHSVALSGVSASTFYTVTVSGADRAGNAVATKSVSFTTAPLPDTTSPAFIAGPTVGAISPTSAVVSWQTDEAATTRVSYGATNVTVPGWLIRHDVTLPGLAPGTRYDLIVASTDAAGNGPSTRSLSFTTLPLADTKPPVITKGPLVRGVEPEAVTVEWETDEAASSIVSFARGSAYQVLSDDERVTRHQLRMTGLTPETTYMVTVASTDAFGNGPTLSAPLPVTTTTQNTAAPVIIGTVEVCQTDQRQVLLCFQTDEPASALVQYGVSDGPLLQSAGQSDLRQEHAIVLGGLSAATTYGYRVTVTDAAGNAFTTPPAQFSTTALPITTPPQFVSVPRITYASNDRVVIEWATDRPTNALVDYGTGTYSRQVADGTLQKQHSVVIAGLSPGATYQFRIQSTDFLGLSVSGNL